jgi:hypothetical protein
LEVFGRFGDGGFFVGVADGLLDAVVSDDEGGGGGCVCGEMVLGYFGFGVEESLLILEALCEEGKLGFIGFTVSAFEDVEGDLS